MQKFEYIFFDLDGTIFDSGYGIKKSVKYALSRFGIDEDDDCRLNAFIGPPLKASFMDLYGFSEDDAVKAISFYREYYTDKGIFRGVLYKDIPKLLAYIKAHDKKSVLATSKPEVFARRIIEHFELNSYFEYIAGASLDESMVDKSEVISYALKAAEIADKSRVLMVGDRKYDIEGAKLNGIKSAGVLYGYGSEAELRNAGADYIAGDARELAHIVML